VNKLIILRGNSGSGKSTVARRIQREAGVPVAIIEQDYYRHELLYPWDERAIKARASIMTQNAVTLLRLGYTVIIEGVMSGERFGLIYHQILAEWSGESTVYYFAVSLNETLRRHQTRSKRHDFSEQDMRAWYKENDMLGADILIGENMTADEIVGRILETLR
jgi:adenylate kinase family enzyme